MIAGGPELATQTGEDISRIDPSRSINWGGSILYNTHHRKVNWQHLIISSKSFRLLSMLKKISLKNLGTEITTGQLINSFFA